MQVIAIAHQLAVVTEYNMQMETLPPPTFPNGNWWPPPEFVGIACLTLFAEQRQQQQNYLKYQEKEADRLTTCVLVCLFVSPTTSIYFLPFFIQAFWMTTTSWCSSTTKTGRWTASASPVWASSTPSSSSSAPSATAWSAWRWLASRRCAPRVTSSSSTWPSPTCCSASSPFPSHW